MVIGEVILKQYVIYEESFWSDLLVAFREFNGGMFDDNDFEVMVKELEDYQNEVGLIQQMEKILEEFLEMMFNELDSKDFYSVNADYKVIGNTFVLAFTYQTY